MRFVDLHCDTMLRIYSGKSACLRSNAGHVDLEKLRSAGYALQCFALFFRLRGEPDPWAKVNAMADLFDSETAANADLVSPVRSFADIEKAEKDGKTAALLTVEEGGVCGGSLEKLRALYDRGVRLITITWNYENGLGWPNMPADGGAGLTPLTAVPDTEHGLTQTGIEFVREMERLGMVVDVSHLSDAGFYDVLKYTSAPFMASHSNARAVCGCVRNLTDDMIRRLADRGGVSGLNLYSSFLTGDGTGDLADAIGRHARHMADVGGEDFVALGSDFDGIPTNSAIPDAAHMPLMAGILSGAGFTARQIDKITSGNALRVLKARIG